MSKFDYAIEQISQCVLFLGNEYDREAWDMVRPVLEAAAKVDKATAMSGWFEWGHAQQTKYSNAHMVNVAESIRALLAALPDDTDEKENP